MTIVAAYAAAPLFKGLAEIFIYATRAEIPPSSTPAPSVTPLPPPVATSSGSNVPQRASSGGGGSPGTEAQFRNLEGIAVDGAGNVYVADMSNNCIRQVSPEGVVSTLAGSTQGFADGTGADAQFNWPQGVAIDAAGNLYVVDRQNHRIRKITLSR